MRQSSVVILSAVIAAAAAVGGSAVVGHYTLESARSSARADAAREREREGAVARGAARVLIDELDDVQIYLASTLEQRRTLSLNEDARVVLQQEDEQLLASRLTAEEWVAVKDTTNAVQQARQVVEAANFAADQPSSQGGVELKGEFRAALEPAVGQIDTGQRALARLAGLPVAPGNEFGPPGPGAK